MKSRRPKSMPFRLFLFGPFWGYPLILIGIFTVVDSDLRSTYRIKLWWLVAIAIFVVLVWGIGIQWLPR